MPWPSWRLLPFALAALSAASPDSAWAASGEAQPSLARPSSQTPAAVAAWLTRHTSMDPNSVVSVGDEYIVAVLSSRTLDPAKPRVLRLEIRAEMTDPDTETANLLRSLSATLDINCADHTSHFIEVRTFAGVNLTGAEQVNHPAEGWVANPHGSYFEDIDAAVCTPGGSRPLLAARTAPPPTPDRPPPERTLSAPLRAEEAPDIPTRSRRGLARPVVAQPAVAQPTVDRAGGVVQVAAALSQAKAEAALAELRSAQPVLTAGLSTRIEQIDRRGVAYFRALVFGFTAPATAASFCRQLEASGRACLVR
jgi:hypothetical protein